ncbi:aryl-alcohol dehydrogenase [Athelia psychrophila]|uniref:Aryl-alcohol dehydrogenase n=1 Tax=Athelia psychrophila TaxID=1759441 RepID=A0A166P880_9AGAM|nr:aryl-alcohol dehydrogenase [Fibularhizoctonia sp. CBS 109695]
MPYVRLGKSGLKVSKIILGCMSYGLPGGPTAWSLGEEEGIAHIKAAYDAGINTFDTANVYSNGLSEVILGKAIKQHNFNRDEIVVMTKVFFTVGHANDTKDTPESGGYVNQRGLSRKHIFESVAHSLRRLQLDYVDVLQCHWFDDNTPIEETMRALHDVVQAGHARYIGMSSCYAWQFHMMQNYAISNGLTPFISMQNHYCMLYREEEREMMPTLKHFGVGSIPWSPLARGILTRPLSSEKPPSERQQKDSTLGMYLKNPKDKEIVGRLEEIAKKISASMAQTALAWLMAKDGVTAPIVGTTSLANLHDLLGAVHITLAEEDIKYLDELYEPRASLMGK